MKIMNFIKSPLESSVCVCIYRYTNILCNEGKVDIKTSATLRNLRKSTSTTELQAELEASLTEHYFYLAEQLTNYDYSDLNS